MNWWGSDGLYSIEIVNYSPEEYGKLLREIRQKGFWCSTDTDYDPDKKKVDQKNER